MSIDTTKYPMLANMERWPTCKECDGRMVRVEAFGVGDWMCLDWDCDASVETDAQLDNRLQNEAELAYEYQQETLRATGGAKADFLNPDLMSQGLKR